MSGFKAPELSQFYHRLHARGESTESLARAVGRGRATVSRVLTGARRRGPIWTKLQGILTAEEVRLLDVAQSSTWNTRRVEKRPRWTAEKVAALAETYTGKFEDERDRLRRVEAVA